MYYNKFTMEEYTDKKLDEMKDAAHTSMWNDIYDNPEEYFYYSKVQNEYGVVHAWSDNKNFRTGGPNYFSLEYREMNDWDKKSSFISFIETDLPDHQQAHVE